MAIHVKICGITNPEDAWAAVDAGADAIGVVFATSPRQVTVAQAAVIRRAVPNGIDLVGVFVAEPFAAVRRAVEAARLNSVQMHRRPEDIWPADDVTAFRELLEERRLRYVMALKARDAVTLTAELDRGLENADQLLLDAFVAGEEGGTGVAFDWTLATLATHRGIPTIVAGGLTPQNVGEAIRQSSPWGVDVSSGVEASPGRKDPDAVRAFIASAKQADLTTESRDDGEAKKRRNTSS